MFEKLIKKIRNNKINTFSILSGIAIFAFGIAVVIANSSGTYAVSTNSCYVCNSPSTFKVWGSSSPNDSNCQSGWHMDSNISESDCVYYTLVFDAKGGNGAPSILYKSKDVDVTISTITPIKSGYTFLGWDTSFTAATVRYMPGDTYAVNENSTLYAVWGADYTISYDAKGGSGAPQAQTKKTNASLTLSDVVPKKEGFEFLGWDTSFTAATVVYKPGDTYTANGDATLYAVWGANYTISYDAKGGSGAPQAQTKKSGSSLILSDVIPKKEGFEFLGWDTSFTAATVVYKPGDTYTANGDVTLYAVWGANYTISYDAKGGSGAPQAQTKKSNASLILSDVVPKKEGFEFLGWDTSFTAATVVYKAGDTYTANGDATLYAVWKIADRGAGCYVGATSQGEGIPTWYDSDPDLNNEHPVFKKVGNEQCDNSGFPDDNTPDDNTPDDNNPDDNNPTTITYTIKYNANGGTGTTENSVHTYDVAKKLTKNGFSRVGYTFVGWSEKADGSVQYSDEEEVLNLRSTNNALVELYAIWSANEYSISYELNNSNVTGNPVKAKYDEEVTINNPTKVVTIIGNDNKMDAKISDNVVANIKFEGWSSIDIDPKTAYYDDTLWDGIVKTKSTLFKNLTPVKDGKVTLVANWLSEEVLLPTVEKEGYTCRWDTKSDGKGTSYNSGGKYVIESDSPATVNLYAICSDNSNPDDDIDNGPQTGDMLIYIVWAVGIGALGYTVYYFVKRKNNI